ncbi:MAG: peptidase MA family metallohydrolase, partial [Ardenticatenaceae bacterium]
MTKIPSQKIWALIGLVALLMAAGVPASGVSAEPSASVRIVSNSEEINFPNEVVFRLEAESDANIADVRLYYRLAGRNITAYGYPDISETSGRVTAEFRVETSGPNYIPPGTDFEYYYVITDASGGEYETDLMRFEYLDPSFDWRRYQQNDLIILYHDRSERTVRNVAEEVNSRLRDVRRLMGLELGTPMKAVILNNSRESSRSFPLISQTARQDHVFGGFAFGEYDLFLLMGLNRDGIIHEMTHLLLDEAVSSPLAQIPAWLNEGLAQHFESGGSGRATAVSDAASSGDLLALRSMGRIPGRPQEVRIFYPQAWSVVDYMLTAYDEARMSNLLQAINQGSRIEEAIPAAYGVTLSELEAQWLRTVSDNISPSQSVDPGTLGTSLVIAGAAAVA